FDFVRHLRAGRAAGYNPWEAPSLEWLSARAQHGFRSIMPIRTRYPLWEEPELREDERAGRGYLPDAPTVERQALITGPITAEPEQIISLPGPGWTGFIAAIGTAVVFGAMTLKLTVVGAIGGVIALAAYLYWFWTMDAARPRELADAGRGLALPLYRNGRESVGWWGMMVLLIADAAVTACFVFAYLFLWTARPAEWPPDGTAL